MDSSTGEHTSGDTTTKQFIELTVGFLGALSIKRT